MDGGIHLYSSDRKAVLVLYRNGGSEKVCRRAQIVWLAVENYSWRTVSKQPSNTHSQHSVPLLRRNYLGQTSRRGSGSV